MKKGNLFLVIFGLILLTGMYATNHTLANEYQNIDLTDRYKNYVSIPSEAYSVLAISGSNGYPIEIAHAQTDAIKVLRSRVDHFKSNLINDTLFIEFTGSNIPMEQRFHSDTPSGIIIEKNTLSSILNINTHQRISGFSNQDLTLILEGNAFIEVSNCDVHTLDIDMKHRSQIGFSHKNTVDSLHIKMVNTSIARLQEIEFRAIQHTLSDSITVVLSKGVFNRVLE
ncbi:hypothetical protein [Dokdonia sp.]|uniref:hypothetical protein n=1 Tax=Dokdonia sp. TaxID=2024995 RepID=UPI0032660C7A